MLAVACLSLASAVPAAAASWSSPVTVHAGDPDAAPGGSHVAIDSAGYGVAAFSESVALRVAERVPGGAWQASPVPLSTGFTAYRYDVAIDPDGNALAVWDMFTPTAQTIEASTWHPGAAEWSPATVVATTPSTVSSEDWDPGVQFSASSNASGEIVVSWQSRAWEVGEGYVTRVYGTVGTPTGGFSPPVDVATLDETDMAFNMTTAIGPAGDAAIQWTREYVGGKSLYKRSDIEVAVGPAATGFALEAPLEVTDLVAPAYAEGGSVAVDSAGDVLSTFFESVPSDVLPSDFRVASSYRAAGGSFGPLARIAALNDGWNSNQIVAAFDAHGNATTAWIGLAPPGEPYSPAILYSAERPAGTSAQWEPSIQLTDPVESGIGALDIAEADDGSAILALDPAGSLDTDLRLTRSGSGAFGAPEQLMCIGSAIAIAPNDDAVMSCSGAHDHSEQMATRYTNEQIPPQLSDPGSTLGAPTIVASPAPPATDAATGHPPGGLSRPIAVRTVVFALGLRSARVMHRRLVLHGTASGRGTVSIAIRRRVRHTTVAVIRVNLRGGAWTRSLELPRGLAVGTYDVVAASAHVRGATTSFHLSHGS